MSLDRVVEWSFLGHLMHSFSRGKSLEQILRSEEKVFKELLRRPENGNGGEGDLRNTELTLQVKSGSPPWGL